MNQTHIVLFKYKYNITQKNIVKLIFMYTYSYKIKI